MKRIPFYNLYRLVVNVLIFACFITSCTKKTTEITPTGASEEIASVANLKPAPSLSTVLLRVSISDVSGNKITSDGLGDYVNGVNNTKAELDATGSFNFDCRNQSSPNQAIPLIRWVSFNFDSPLPGSPIISLPFTGNIQKGNRIVTSSATPTTATAIQSMTVGSSQCIGLATGSTYTTKTDPLPIWRVSFHGNNENSISSPTAYATITRNSDTQWTIVPGNCSISSNTDVGALRNGSTLYGNYHMPFSIILTKL